MTIVRAENNVEVAEITTDEFELLLKEVYNKAIDDFVSVLFNGEQNEEFMYNINKIAKKLKSTEKICIYNKR